MAESWCRCSSVALPRLSSAHHVYTAVYFRYWYSSTRSSRCAHTASASTARFATFPRTSFRGLQKSIHSCFFKVVRISIYIFQRAFCLSATVVHILIELVLIVSATRRIFIRPFQNVVGLVRRVFGHVSHTISDIGRTISKLCLIVSERYVLLVRRARVLFGHAPTFVKSFSDSFHCFSHLFGHGSDSFEVVSDHFQIGS